MDKETEKHPGAVLYLDNGKKIVLELPARVGTQHCEQLYLGGGQRNFRPPSH